MGWLSDAWEGTKAAVDGAVNMVVKNPVIAVAVAPLSAAALAAKGVLVAGETVVKGVGFAIQNPGEAFNNVMRTRDLVGQGLTYAVTGTVGGIADLGRFTARKVVNLTSHVMPWEKWEAPEGGYEGFAAALKRQTTFITPKNDYERTVLFASQAVGEVGVFIGVSVATGGVGGAALAAARGGSVAVRTAQTLNTAKGASTVFTKTRNLQTVWEGAKEGANLGWRFSRPFTTRAQRLDEAGTLAANRLASGLQHKAKYAEAPSKWGKTWHGMRATRMLGEASEIGVRSNRLGFLGRNGEKLGIAFESERAAEKFTLGAKVYTETFSKSAADDSVRRIFGWKAGTPLAKEATQAGAPYANVARAGFPGIHNFGVIDNIRRTALQNPEKYTKFYNPLKHVADVARDGGAVLGYAGMFEAAGGAFSFTMNYNAEVAVDKQANGVAEAVDEMGIDIMRNSGQGAAPTEGEDHSALPAETQLATLGPDFDAASVIPVAAPVSDNNAYFTLAAQIVEKQRSAPKVLLAETDTPSADITRA